MEDTSIDKFLQLAEKNKRMQPQPRPKLEIRGWLFNNVDSSQSSNLVQQKIMIASEIQNLVFERVLLASKCKIQNVAAAAAKFRIKSFWYRVGGRPRDATGGHGRPREAIGDHKGEFPRTDLGPVRKPTSLATPPGPLKLRFFRDLYVYLFPKQA